MKILKGLLFPGVISLSLVSLFSMCKKDSAAPLIGNWIEQSDFEGVARGDAAAFTIGNIAYVGTGYDGEDRLSDFWAYDAERNNWTQIAEFPGQPRQGAVAFTAGGEGYVGTGYDGLVKYKDFYRYNPTTNAWHKVMAEFGGLARYGAVAFSIDNIGYVGTGFSGNAEKDFWAYNTADSTWLQKTSYQSKVQDAAAFVIDGKGYITTGYSNGEYSKDFYMYDPANDTWTAKRKISNVSNEAYDDGYTIIRKKAAVFVLNGKAYITCGDIGNLKNDVWEYTPSTDLWATRTSFEGTARTDAVGFATENGRGFVTTGISSTLTFDDIWEFKPLDDFNEAD
jgi:N-acetylneuraminic acid mutarotase